MFIRKTKKYLFIMFALITLTGLMCVLRLPADLEERLEPVTAPLPVFNSQPLVIIADERVFTLYAAYNAAGFDREYEGISMSPIRLQVRAALSEKDLPSLARLNQYFEKIPVYHLVTWILQRGNPPDFGRAETGWWVSALAVDFDGLDQALSAFYYEADIPNIWHEVEPAFQAEINSWQPLAEQSIGHIQAYLGISSLPFRQAVIIPNPLDAYYSGTGPQVGEIAYVVAGPTETELSLQGLIEHELLHSVIGPMLDQSIEQIPAQTSNRLYSVLRYTMPSSYGTWASVLEETLIRAINLRMLDDPILRAQQLEQLESQGFLLIRPLDYALAAYEQSYQSFEQYLPTLLASLDDVELSGE